MALYAFTNNIFRLNLTLPTAQKVIPSIPPYVPFLTVDPMALECYYQLLYK